MLGKDGQIYSETIPSASTLFDAAAQGVERWARLWFYDRDAKIMVNLDGKRWVVEQARLREWRKAKPRA